MDVDYRSLLDVNPNDPFCTCVGTTKKSLRCRLFPNYAQRAEASNILDDLPAIVDSRIQYDLFTALRRLAYLTLCTRWHQSTLSQVEPVASKWLAQIQNRGFQAPTYSLPTPPPSPPRFVTYQQSIFGPPPPQTPVPIHTQISRGLFYQPGYISPPQSPSYTPGDQFRQQLFGPPQQPAQPPTMSPNNPPQYNSSTEPNVQQSRYTSQTGRNVNITFNIAVDSNQINRDDGRNTHGHGVTANTSPSPSSNNPRSGGSDQSSRSRSPASSTSSSSSHNRHAVETVTAERDAATAERDALQAQVAILTERLQATEAHSPQSPRSLDRSVYLGSPVPSMASEIDLPSPRVRTLTISPRSSRNSSGSSRSRHSSAPHPEHHPGSSSNHSSSSSSSSSSTHTLGRAIARINTPSSSGGSSPVLVSPPRSPSIPRSAAPSPSTASSGVSASVHRRPITADTTCYVCYEPIGSEADAAWCRSSCGQNICLSCLMAWITEQRSAGNGGGILCGYW